VGAARQPRSKGGKTPSRRRQAAPPIPVLPGHRRKFRERLLKWYAQHGRDLPWRKTAVPYEILVSEIMLQQTQVDRVLPKYQEWLAKYPTMEDLAEAPLSDVKKTWYPLGYNIRPVRLHSIARESVVRYGGTLPRDPERLLAFKGIGRYTAGAIRAFAFREDAPILDTNVMRVLHRVFVGKGDAKRQKTALWGLSEAMIPRGKGYDFNQALMDFGAMVCIARDPYCLLCPMNGFCKAYPFQRDR
jgi:A/G-specific adenine glycosylase